MTRTKYSNLYRVRNSSTPQNQPAPQKVQVKNNAGGFVFQISCWDHLDRFLILGTDTNTYYSKARQNTMAGINALDECLTQDPYRTINRIVEISTTARAPRNDHALFALAYCASWKINSNDTPEVMIRTEALKHLNAVARTGTHLFQFVDYVEGLRGWGRALKRAVANWYNLRHGKQLAYQVAKYKQRNGWSQRDILRLSKPRPSTNMHQNIFAWVVGKEFDRNKLPDALNYHDELHSAKSEKEVLDIIRRSAIDKNGNLAWEFLPTEYLASADVWRELIPILPYMALIRNLGRLASLGLLKEFTQTAKDVESRLTNETAIQYSKIHPYNILLALSTYQSGRGVKGNLSWNVNQKIVQALEFAFYESFANVTPSGKNIMLALDVSSSMDHATVDGGILTAATASAAMAMVSARTEPNTMIVGFSGNMWGNDPKKRSQMANLNIGPQHDLNTVLRKVREMTFGRTDCAQPMLYAMENNLDVDAFVIYTDNETWAGDVHPFEALEQYRTKMNKPDAKLVVVGMTSTGFSIANPNDKNMLDCVGFDASAPQLVSSFISN